MFSLPRKPNPNQKGQGRETEPYLTSKSTREGAGHIAISVPEETPAWNETLEIPTRLVTFPRVRQSLVGMRGGSDPPP